MDGTNTMVKVLDDKHVALYGLDNRHMKFIFNHPQLVIQTENVL